ncbi:guanylate-binding protein 2-like isoform X2 [Phacochoerus africanus]|uniref:guanylate-binding protein 2-like isoform X2 n=1 Tax=Phacochoerus africanus TaxID=41426 RepID=UPI001FDA055B|nr:guanylate-binding protein 2-like isoform X2 [Phacochoerus africanus]
MATETLMAGPECLIENINGRLMVNLETAKILSAITQPVVVVVIVGPYRTGKSYLMNKLAGKNKGFSLGSTVQSHTKGIWMWCVPHPRNPDHTLVLLDTEGLGDVEKGDNQNDSWLFALAVLLSSTLIYNSVGTINQQAMDQLHYVTELTDCIRAKSSPGKHEIKDSADFVSFFPDFVWTLRDFSLDLQANGEPITPDEYLENSLKLKQGLETLVLTFVNTISSGDLPCMENAVLALAEIENSAAVQKAVAHYEQQMAEKLQLPTETLQELLDLHRDVEKEAIDVFMTKSFKDVDQVFQTRLMEELEAKLVDFCDQNMKASSDYCMTLLQDIFEPLYEDVKQGTFFKPGGFRLFIRKRQELKNKYYQVPRKGIQADETLKQYLDSREGMDAALLQTDQSLTEKEKEIEVQWMKSESLEAANRISEEMQKKHEQLMQEKEKSFHEHMKQLAEKMEKERAQLMAEQERVLTLKFQEKERLLEQGFKKESLKLLKEMKAIQLRNSESFPMCSIL